MNILDITKYNTDINFFQSISLYYMLKCSDSYRLLPQHINTCLFFVTLICHSNHSTSKLNLVVAIPFIMSFKFAHVGLSLLSRISISNTDATLYAMNKDLLTYCLSCQ